MFEGYLTGATKTRATRSRRFGGHAAAVVVHVAAVVAAARFAPRTPAAPAAEMLTAVPVRMTPVYWREATPIASQAGPPRPAPTAEIPAPPARSRAPGPRPRRTARASATAAAPTVETPTSAAVVLNDDGGSPSEKASGVDPAHGPPSPSAMPVAAPAPTAPIASGPPAPPATPRFLPESLSQQQRIVATPPDFPAFLAVNGAFYVIHARICVAGSGEVERLELLKTAHPTLDANVRSAVGKWRYRPLLAGTVAVPFCTLVRFEFRAT